MQVKDADLTRIVERLGEHYRVNINNRVMRPVLMKMDLPNSTWELIDRLVAPPEQQRGQGWDFDDLYEQILAMAAFVSHAQHGVAPSIRALLSAHQGPRPASSTDRVLRDMAINNFGSNLGVLSDILNELYLKAVELDKQYNGEKQAVYMRKPELKTIGQLLI